MWWWQNAPDFSQLTAACLACKCLPLKLWSQCHHWKCWQYWYHFFLLKTLKVSVGLLFWNDSSLLDGFPVIPSHRLASVAFTSLRISPYSPIFHWLVFFPLTGSYMCITYSASSLRAPNFTPSTTILPTQSHLQVHMVFFFAVNLWN